MRKITFFIALLIGLSSFAQNVVAYRSAPLVGGGPYFLNGMAFIEELSDGTFRFRLDNNYATNQGPDVQIFMSNDNNFSTPINTVGALFVEDVGFEDGINQFSGAYMKILPGISSLTDFDFVVFTCYRFNKLHWGNGTFGAIVSSCTTTTSSIVVSACDSYTAPSGQIYTSSAVVTDVISNAMGCDSIITIDLTVNTVDVTTALVGNVVTANAAGASYQWIDCTNNNTPVAGATDQSYTILDENEYAVIVTEGNCSGTSACVGSLSVGIDEDTFGADIQVFPNPAQGQVTITLGEQKEAVSISVVDVTGKTIYNNQQETKSQVELDLADFNNGLYFVMIHNNEGERVIKLVKQ